MSNIVCICKNITEETIVDAIKSGAKTVDEVKEKTGATAGMCHGARCKAKIQELIDQNK